MSDAWHEVGDAGGEPEGTLRRVEVGETAVCVARTGDGWLAFDDTCTHEAASLSDEGMIEGSNVVCGWHFCGFDIATGAATASPCNEPLRTYPVQLIDGVLHVEY